MTLGRFVSIQISPDHLLRCNSQSLKMRALSNRPLTLWSGPEQKVACRLSGVRVRAPLATMNERYVVTVAVTRQNGSTEQVPVGTAVRLGEGFSLTLGSMSLVAEPASSGRSTAERTRGGSGSGGDMVFPPYGKSKGQPLVGASLRDLEFYASGCKRTLGDASKSRWHEKERVLLAAIEAEIARQGGESAGVGDGFGYEGPPPFDDDAPF